MLGLSHTSDKAQNKKKHDDKIRDQQYRFYWLLVCMNS